MKNFKFYLLAAFAALNLISCNDNDDADEQVSENKVDAYIQFENVFSDHDFNLNHDYTSANNGVLNITALKYMITDITFYGSNGTADYTVPTQESFHIIDASCEATDYKYLTGIPDGTYNKISFRYGVSEEVFELGTEAQGDMLVAANEFGMNWGWTSGYQFLKYEGSYAGNAANTFKVHNGSHGSSSTGHGTANKSVTDAPSRIDNSKLITLAFSNDADILVSDNTSPKVHLKIDVANIFNSTNLIDISEGNIIIDAHKSPKVATNVATMFSVDHIHGTTAVFDIPENEGCGSANPNEETTEHDH
ncbi:MbnP family protein [Flavicella sediminum]|uniref:MbnP family protein n=1 Tax=Flavicella sediminum TaxID=2585141 RepID=UPI0011243860|nr:MbnP family protein [Flavicella sediminum]